MKPKINLLAIVVAFLLNSCSKEVIRGEGTITTEQRNVSSFTKIKTFGSNNVFVSQGAVFNVEVKGSGNLLPYFETNVAGSVLSLRYKSNTRVKNDNIEIHITMPLLTGLWSFGSGNIFCTGNFTGNISFEASIHGSGDISIEKGDTQKFTGAITGSGSINAFGFDTENADITITGSGNQEISVSTTLGGNISGSGNIYYKGNPAVNSHITGSGSIIKQ